jgi:hypothetical protein
MKKINEGKSIYDITIRLFFLVAIVAWCLMIM